MRTENINTQENLEMESFGRSYEHLFDGPHLHLISSSGKGSECESVANHHVVIGKVRNKEDGSVSRSGRGCGQ